MKLFLFGPPRLERDDQSIEVSRRKAMALLAYLAATGPAHSRDTLATLLWPDVSRRLSRGNLRRALSAQARGQLAAAQGDQKDAIAYYTAARSQYQEPKNEYAAAQCAEALKHLSAIA